MRDVNLPTALINEQADQSASGAVESNGDETEAQVRSTKRLCWRQLEQGRTATIEFEPSLAGEVQRADYEKR